MDLIISKLLDCRGSSEDNACALYSKKKFDKKSNKKQRKCYNCGSPQHLANACDQPKKDGKTDKGDKSAKAVFMMALSSTDACSESESEHEDENKAEVKGFLGTSNKSVWFVDSGGSRHVTPYSDLIENRNNDKDKITAANGENLKIMGTGDGKVTFGDGSVSVKRLMQVWQ